MATTVVSKRCCTCKTEKPIAEFYRSPNRKDGLNSQCKTCHKESMKKYRDSESGKAVRRAGDRAYEASERGKEVKKKYKRSAKGRAQQRREAKTEKSKARCKRHYQRDMENGKKPARNALGRAIESGKIPPAKTLKCSHCQKQAEAYHHPSYAKEDHLKVIPVCDQCHSDIHRGKIT
jgi:hypothetical protein